MKKGVCEDTKLPTIQLMGEHRERGFQKRERNDIVELSTKDTRNPKRRQMLQMFEGLGTTSEAHQQAIRDGNFIAAAQDFADEDAMGAERFGARDFMANEELGEDFTGARAQGSGSSAQASPLKAYPELTPVKALQDPDEDWHDEIAEIQEKQKARKMYQGLSVKIGAALNDLTEAIVSCEELVKIDRACFEQHLALLKSRNQALRATQGDATAMSAYKNEITPRQEAGAKPVAEKRLPIPATYFQMLQTCTEVEAKVESIEGTCPETLVKSSEAWTAQSYMPLKVLCDQCNNVLRAFQSASQAKKKDQEAAAKKAALKAKTAAQAEARKRVKEVSASMDVPSADGFGIFSLDFSAHPSVAECMTEPGQVQMNIEEPYVVRPSPTTLSAAQEAPCRLNLLVFKASLVKGASTRDHKILKGATQVGLEGGVSPLRPSLWASAQLSLVFS